MNIMHTIASDARTTQAPKRRFYSPELKLQVVAACSQSGASIAGVALPHGINASIVHRWLREHNQGTPQSTTDIRIEVKRANATIVVHWPLVSLAPPTRSGCASACSVRIDAVWLSTVPLDMRAGTDTALARVVGVFGAAYPPFSQAGGALLFHLLSKLYEHTSVVITTNLSFSEWSAVFIDAKMTMALRDRLTHHCHIVETGNESYRFRHSSMAAKMRIKARESERKGGKAVPPAEVPDEPF